MTPRLPKENTQLLRALKIFSQTPFRVQEDCFLRKIHTIHIPICLKGIQFWSSAAHMRLTKQRIKNRNFLACLGIDPTQPQNRVISSFSSISVYYLSNRTIKSILAYVYNDSFHWLQHILDLDLIQYFKGEDVSPTENITAFCYQTQNHFLKSWRIDSLQSNTVCSCPILILWRCLP